MILNSLFSIFLFTLLREKTIYYIKFGFLEFDMAKRDHALRSYFD